MVDSLIVSAALAQDLPVFYPCKNVFDSGSGLDMSSPGFRFGAWWSGYRVCKGSVAAVGFVDRPLGGAVARATMMSFLFPGHALPTYKILLSWVEITWAFTDRR